MAKRAKSKNLTSPFGGVYIFAKNVKNEGQILSEGKTAITHIVTDKYSGKGKVSAKSNESSRSTDRLFHNPFFIIAVITLIISFISIPWWPYLLQKVKAISSESSNIAKFLPTVPVLITNPSNVVMEMSKFENKDKTIKITYPQVISGLTNNQTDDFNQFIQRTIQQIYDYRRVDLPTNWLGESIVERSDTKIISLRLNILVSPDNAIHPVSFTQAINYSVVENKNLSIQDLFDNKTDYLNALSKITKEKIIEGYKRDGRYDDGLLTFIDNGTKPQVKSFEKFVIGKDYLIFIFDSYIVGPYSEGTREVKFSFKELKDLLNGTFYTLEL